MKKCIFFSPLLSDVVIEIYGLFLEGKSGEWSVSGDEELDGFEVVAHLLFYPLIDTPVPIGNLGTTP